MQGGVGGGWEGSGGALWAPPERGQNVGLRGSAEPPPPLARGFIYRCRAVSSPFPTFPSRGGRPEFELGVGDPPRGVGGVWPGPSKSKEMGINI